LYESLPPSLRGKSARNSAALAPDVAAAVRRGDVVMIKGSHSMHMERIVDALRSAEKQKASQKMAS